VFIQHNAAIYFSIYEFIQLLAAYPAEGGLPLTLAVLGYFLRLQRSEARDSSITPRA